MENINVEAAKDQAKSTTLMGVLMMASGKTIKNTGLAK